MRNLINFLLKYNYWFLFVILEVASFVLLFRFNNYQQSAYFTSANTVVGAVYEVSGGISSYFHLKSVNEDLLDRNMLLEEQINNLEKALKERQLDSIAVNSIRKMPQKDYQLFKARVIKNSLNLADNYITLDKGSSSGIHSRSIGKHVNGKPKKEGPQHQFIPGSAGIELQNKINIEKRRSISGYMHIIQN